MKDKYVRPSLPNSEVAERASEPKRSPSKGQKADKAASFRSCPFSSLQE